MNDLYQRSFDFYALINWKKGFDDFRDDFYSQAQSLLRFTWNIMR